MVNAASNTHSKGTSGAGASSRVQATGGAGAQATAHVQHAPHAEPAAIASNARTILELAPEALNGKTHLQLPGGMVLRTTSTGDAVIIQSDADRRAGAFKGLSIARDQRDPGGTPLFTIDMEQVGHDWPAMANWTDLLKSASELCTQRTSGIIRTATNSLLVAFHLRNKPEPVTTRKQDSEQFRALLPATNVATDPPPTTAASASVSASTATELTLAFQFGVSPREPVSEMQLGSITHKSWEAVKKVLAPGKHFTLQIGDTPVTVVRSHAGEYYEARPVHAARTGEASASSWIEVTEDAANDNLRVGLNNATIDATHPDAPVVAAVMAAIGTHARSLKQDPLQKP